MEKVKREQKTVHKVATWSLFVALAILVIAGAGLYALKNEDKLNAEILEGVQKIEPIKETVADNTVDPDAEIKEIDDQLNAISEEDFADTSLNDVSLSIQ